MLYIALLLSGVLGGVLAGMLGIGGGIIYVFALGFFLPKYGVVEAEFAQFIIANSLFCVFFASISSSISLYKRKEFYPRYVLLLGIPAVISSVGILLFVVNTPWFTRDTFNVIISGLMLYMLYKTVRKAVSVRDDRPIQEIHTAKLSFAGLMGGLVASVSGLGGGVVMVPLLNGIMKVNIKVTKSISLGVITMLSFVVSVYNLFVTVESDVNTLSSGLIVFPVSLVIVLGVIVGGPIGVWVSSRMNNRTISIIYAVFLTLFIVKKGIELYF